MKRYYFATASIAIGECNCGGHRPSVGVSLLAWLVAEMAHFCAKKIGAFRDFKNSNEPCRHPCAIKFQNSWIFFIFLKSKALMAHVVHARCVPSGHYVPQQCKAAHSRGLCTWIYKSSSAAQCSSCLCKRILPHFVSVIFLLFSLLFLPITIKNSNKKMKS